MYGHYSRVSPKSYLCSSVTLDSFSLSDSFVTLLLRFLMVYYLDFKTVFLSVFFYFTDLHRPPLPLVSFAFDFGYYFALDFYLFGIIAFAFIYDEASSSGKFPGISRASIMVY